MVERFLMLSYKSFKSGPSRLVDKDLLYCMLGVIIQFAPQLSRIVDKKEINIIAMAFTRKHPVLGEGIN